MAALTFIYSASLGHEKSHYFLLGMQHMSTEAGVKLAIQLKDSSWLSVASLN